MNEDIKQLNEKIKEESAFLELLNIEISKTIIGQKNMVDRLILALLANGHILLEGLPGLAKTLAIKTISKLINASFSRIQFTPDLLPSDVIGTSIFNINKNNFSIKKGPIFGNFILADEINRAPAKVQSALLEAMEERQVTISENTFKLDEPFLVLATQNPVDQEGTYQLPEAQVDRFMLKTIVEYPKLEDERIILRNETKNNLINSVVNINQVIEARSFVNKIYMDEKIEKYILDIIFSTRFPNDYKLSELSPLISFGASPRGTINLSACSKAFAFMKGRGFVIPDDVRSICHDVLRHRIGLTYEAEAENISSTEIIDKILNKIEVP
jgi:MoxR-like ATPase